MRSFDYFFDLGSPYSYLASTQLRRLCDSASARVVLHPIAMGGVRKELGTQLPCAAQLRYAFDDVKRWAERYRVPMAIPGSFPARTLQALRACVAAGLEGKGEEAMAALFSAHWAAGLDISDRPVIEAALGGAGLDGPRLVGRTEEPEIKDRLRKNTELALRRGLFGVPTFFVGERSFWGNDRLEFVEAALREL